MWESVVGCSWPGIFYRAVLYQVGKLAPLGFFLLLLGCGPLPCGVLLVFLAVVGSGVKAMILFSMVTLYFLYQSAAPFVWKSF